MKALYPKNPLVKSQHWECHDDPDKQMGQQPKVTRIGKNRRDYESRRQDFIEAWPQVRNLFEAERFSQEFLTAFES